MSRPFLSQVITDDSALGGSVIERSLRFNDDDSPYLGRTPSGAGSNQMTFSFWIKRGNLGGTQAIFSSGAVNARAHIYFTSDDKLNCQPFNSSGANTNLVVDRVFRDTSAWYHVVLSFNNSAYNDTASTVNVYVNGVSASFTPSVTNTPTGGNRLNDAQAKRIGELAPDSGSHLDGYLTEFNFIDGQVLDPTYFGYTESQTGLWRPKRYEGTYGTNGFYLDFSDNSSTSALGIDKSPNGNDWSVNNFTTGANLVTNGEFNSDSDWTKDSSWTISGGKASNSGGGEIYQTFAVVSGITYIMKATVDATGDSALGNTSIGFRDTSDTQFYAYQATFANGSFTDLTANAVNEVVIPWTSTVTGNVRFRCYSSDTITIDNWSVIEIADSVTDTPTNNFPVMNPLQRGEDNPTVTDGNLYFGGPTDHAIVATFPIPSSGKWYWEYTKTADANLMSGIIGDPESAQLGTYVGGQSGGYSVYAGNGQTYAAGSNATYMATPPTRTTIMIAYDADTRRLYFGADGHWGDGSGNTDETFANAAVAHTVAAGKTYYPAGSFNSGSAFANYGQQRFSFTPPTGYKALNSKNLPPNVPSIIRPQKHFDTILYTGNGSTRTISGLEFTPDFLWIKNRSSGFSHALFDSVRGPFKRLRCDSNNAEDTNDSDSVSGFVSGGFTTGADDAVNQNSSNIVAWCWKAGGAAVSNTNGNITSSVSVNEEAGFSIVSYTGNGSNGQTVGHGLSKAPQWIMLKSRTAGSNWRVWQHKLASDGSKRLILDANNVSEDASFLNDTAPSSTVFTLGNSDNAWNVNSGTYIAYCWYEVPGYSKFGSYTGNGSTDGTYVHLGFRADFIMIKSSSLETNWNIVTADIDGYNVVTKYLDANTSSAEGTYTFLDVLSNGFKARNVGNSFNQSGASYIYMAFAKQPGTTPFGTFPNAR